MFITHENYYTSIKQPRFRMRQPRVIIIICLYLGKLNLILRISDIFGINELNWTDIAQYVKRWNDNLEIAG